MPPSDREPGSKRTRRRIKYRHNECHCWYCQPGAAKRRAMRGPRSAAKRDAIRREVSDG